MNELQVFVNNRLGSIRTKMIDGKPWFVLIDICKILGIGNASTLKKRLKGDGVSSIEVIDSLGRKQETTIINEQNLYKCVLRSDRDEAIEFEDWITGDVLPSIRKHGMYATEELLNDPDLFIKVLTDLKREREEKKQLQDKVTEDKPKVLFADSVTASRTSILVGELAKLLKQNGVEIGQNRLFLWLRDNGYLISKNSTSYNMPTQKSMNLELFEIKETSITHSDGHITVSKTPKVTGKGQLYFINKFLAG